MAREHGMRSVLMAFALAAVCHPQASAQEGALIFRCIQNGNTFYYRIGPHEFSHWLGASSAGAGRWLPNDCADEAAQCTWENGVLTVTTIAEDVNRFDT